MQERPILHPVMLAGTGSDVGKSVLVAALCRIFRQDGYSPAPFKAQNMALNSYATPDGLEIGRAQAMQAEAAGIPCSVYMNPLLLKPIGNLTSQVVLMGTPIGNRTARESFGGEGREALRQTVNQAYDHLAAQHNPVVLEGAGSLAEINLRHVDLVNLPMARHAGADVILVGDIDRGGVFAQVYGSLMLLTPEERSMVKGIIINKFRGDVSLFMPGARQLEELCGIPVLGIIPYFQHISLDQEDSLSLSQSQTHHTSRPHAINIAVVRLPHMSNFTDFNALAQDPRIHLYYTNQADELRQADLIILPGSKSTIADLLYLRRCALDTVIIEAHRQGVAIVGICGGYQMMGLTISDPEHTEGMTQETTGLALLPVHTRLSSHKVTRQVVFDTPTAQLHDMQGYEIHTGTTTADGAAAPSPLNIRSDGTPDGYLLNRSCMGTYMHGVLDNAAFVEWLLEPFAEQLTGAQAITDYNQFKQEQYDLLAQHVRTHLRMDLLYRILTGHHD